MGKKKACGEGDPESDADPETGAQLTSRLRFADILRSRRLNLSRAKTTTASSLTDSLSDSQHNVGRSHHGALQPMASHSMCSTSSSGLFRNSSIRSTMSGRSNATALTALSSLNVIGSVTSSAAARTRASSSASSSSRPPGKGNRRFSKYEEEISDGQLGINERELISMNKHIPALKSHGKSATFRQHYYPEGGWGWVITLCCFVVNMFTTGMQLSYGVLQAEVAKHGHAGAAAAAAAAARTVGADVAEVGDVDLEWRTNAAWLGAANLAVSHAMAPLLVALCRRKSTRLTAVVGGLVMALAVLFASFARHFHQVFLSYGILLGLGLAMVRETSTLMLSQYFKRKREVVEMLSGMGTGAGIAVFTNVLRNSVDTLGWRYGLQALSGAFSSLFFVGLFYRSASLYHPQRRAILHLKDMSKRKGKDKNKMENKPPYFDFSTLRSRPFQVIVCGTALFCLGGYAPLFYFVPLSLDEGLPVSEALALQTYLGAGCSVGSLLFGMVIITRSQQCSISTQYLLQAAIFGTAVSLLALCSVQGYHGYLLCVWLYGTCLGGFHFALSAYTLERVHMRHFPRAWGFVQGAKALPLLIGIPVAAYIGQATESTKGAYYFSLGCVVLSGIVISLGECCCFFCPSLIPSANSASVAKSPLATSVSNVVGGGESMMLAAGDFPPDPPSRSRASAEPEIDLRCTCPHPPPQLPLLFPQDQSAGADALDLAQDADEGAAAIADMLRGAHVDDVIVVGEEEIVVGHDLLTCISEENLFDKLEAACDADKVASTLASAGGQSQSHPDLLALTELPSQQRGQLGRQRTWHHLRPTQQSSIGTAAAAAACAGNMRWAAAPQGAHHINSFV